jgi:hypothetical protein
MEHMTKTRVLMLYSLTALSFALLSLAWMAGLTKAEARTTRATPQPRSSDGPTGSARVCDDLHRFTCAPGNYPDGTGNAENPTVMRNRLRSVVDNSRALMARRFREELAKPDNGFFRQKILSASNLSLVQDCDGAEGRPSSACLNLMVEGAVQMMSEELASSNPSEASDGRLDDRTLVMSDPVYRAIRGEIRQSLRTQMGGDAIERRISSRIFPDIRALMIQRIDQLVPDPTMRSRIIAKLRGARFEGTDCSSRDGDASLPDALIPNAYYQPNTNTFRYCQGLGLTNSSEFHLAFIVAHELAHSIDPCNLQIGPRDYSFRYRSQEREQAEEEFPIPGLIQCLRSSDSVEATLAPPRQNDPQQGPQKARARAGRNHAGHDHGATKGAPGQAQPFCSDDQIGEAFCDWMAMELLPDYMQKNHPNLTPAQMRNGYSNVWRGSCDTISENHPLYGGVHPNQDRRVDRIIAVHPRAREQMGCQTGPGPGRYCETQAAPAATPAPPARPARSVN